MDAGPPRRRLVSAGVVALMAHGDGPPISTLDDVVQSIRDHLDAAGYLRTDPSDPRTGIEWLEGERYSGQEGAPPRIFWLTGEDGKIGGPGVVDANYVAGVTEQATALLWGDETPADGDRYRAAKSLGVLLFNCLGKVAPGRVTRLSFRRPVKTDLLTFGEEYRLSFSYFWRVPRIAAIWNIPVTPVSPGDPMRPNGDTGTAFDLTLTTTVTR